jgi:hypothetical protein
VHADIGLADQFPSRLVDGGIGLLIRLEHIIDDVRGAFAGDVRNGLGITS